MSVHDYDLVVIGAGSGGVRASRLAAGLGAKVAVVESGPLGGTCVNLGCIPKKLLVYASHFREDIQDAAGFGWTIEGQRFDWQMLIRNKDREIARLNGVYRSLLEKSGVRIVAGRARVTDPNTVEVGQQKFTGRYILIATGGRPAVPELRGSELGITSDDAFHLKELPERIVVVGGGYIAVEFAGIFNGMGSRVTQVYRGPLFLRGFDEDARALLVDAMRAKGIDVRFNTHVIRLEHQGKMIGAQMSDGSVLEADQVLWATGRTPRTDGLGLNEVGVELDEKGAVRVDEYSRTSVPSIYAVGDVTHRMNLTPVALAEAGAVVQTLFNHNPQKMDYRDIPTVVFGQPSLAAVGLTEADARTRCGEIDVYRTAFRPLKHTLSGRDEKVLIKLIVDRTTDRVVGAHMVGPEAGEIIQGIAIAMKCAATKKQFDSTIGVHPTIAEEWVTMRITSPRR